MIAQHITAVGDWFERVGKFALFCSATLRWTIWTLKPTRLLGSRLRLLMPQFYEIGTMSIPVVMLVGAFVGAVLGIEMFDQFASLGQETRMGGVISISVLKQVGPVLAAVMIAGRVGGAVTAELGTMRVTEQIDAMRVMGADPISYLVVPRVMACVLMLPLLTIFSNLMGVLGGWLVVVRGFGVDAAQYWSFSAQFVTSFDIFNGLIKSVVFGLAIGMVSCYKGFNCAPGAEGVGRAATDAFVTSFIAIIISNFFLASFLKPLYNMIYGYGPSTFV